MTLNSKFKGMTRKLGVALAAATIALAGCQSTQTNVTSVGPTLGGPQSGGELGNAKRKYNYSSNIFLDVAIPVFDPGIPTDKYGNIDDEEVVEQDIWPQVRRLEANRFAINTKKALQETNAFGAINVTPDANASADVYVLGKINYSDTETVEIGIRIMDAANRVWDEEEFEFRVSEGFYRDAFRKGGNPYEPIFNQIAAHIYDVLMKKSESEKREIEQIADLRYAAMYSPEAFSPYLEKEKSWGASQAHFELKGAPSAQDPMYQRIQRIQAKDNQFVDSLQDSYETFYAETHDVYRTYQKETLPIAADIRRKKEERTQAQAIAGIGLVAAVLLGKNSGSTAGQVGAAVAGVAAAVSLADAVKTNKEIQGVRDILEEKGENLDIKVTPQVVEFKDQSIELTGTAAEQHTQLRQRLYEIYQLEATPDQQL